MIADPPERAFNARWLAPEDVARSFVPTLAYKDLIQHENSLLMGPRGCGKTTLLKMLTRPAQRVWTGERLPKEPGWAGYRSPTFEAIYVPSDVRWSEELRRLSGELPGHPVLAERAQRALAAITAVTEATRTFEEITDAADSDPMQLLKALIRHVEMGPTVPSFREVRLRLAGWSDRIHSAIIRRDTAHLEEVLKSLPASFTATSLSAVIKACTVVDEYARRGASLPPWALCFDELEIAPDWLQRELLGSLRSLDKQRFLLKLTWSPVLPKHLLPAQEPLHDFVPIPMWNTGAIDARAFCSEFTTRYLRERLREPTVTPRQAFGPSPVAEDTSRDPYKEGTVEWQAMRHLASIDPSFREYLSDKGIPPENPVADSVALRDEALRKVKPIVLAREAFLKEASRGGPLTRRSRKVPPLYYGEDSIYAISEGNPRLLTWLIGSLLTPRRAHYKRGRPLVPPAAQSRVLYAASLRMLATVKSYPITASQRQYPLVYLIRRLGQFQSSELYGPQFKPDPVGSFFVDEDVRQELLDALATGVNIGALVNLGKHDRGEDLAPTVVGMRFRLSFVLAPAFQFLFRNYREIRLSTALRIPTPTQGSFL